MRVSAEERNCLEGVYTVKRSGKHAGDESKRMLPCNALLIFCTSMQAVRANNIVMYVFIPFWTKNDHGKTLGLCISKRELEKHKVYSLLRLCGRNCLPVAESEMLTGFFSFGCSA